MSNDTSPDVSDINLELPEISAEGAQELASDIFTGLSGMVVDYNYWIPIIIVIFSLFAGAVARHYIRPTLISLIDRINTSYRMNIILKNMTKLTLPAIALLFVIIFQISFITFFPDLHVFVLTAVSKLLIAWIIIRIVAQVIQNNFVRQIVAFLGWIIAAISILGVMPEATFALDAIGMDFGDFRFSLLTVVKFLIAFFILLTFTRILTNTAERSLQSATDLTPSARVLLIKIIKVTLIALAR